jgi:phosphoribosylaminoimidazole-succinocarboxamide synthase
MKKLKFIRNGSSKDIYRVDKKTLAFRFNDYFSVFDVGRSRDTIPGKGEAICRCAIKSFEIAATIGVPTHFIEQIDKVTIRVQEAQIITNRPITEKDENYMVPIELIYRLKVAGSFDRDFRSGKKKPEDYGLPAGIIPEVGTPFPWPIRYRTTKFEHIDRELSDEEACTMSGITMKDLDEFWYMDLMLDGAITYAMKRAGFDDFDGKKELIMGPGRMKKFGDVFGTPDEDRPYKIINGEIVHYSKEFIRQIFIENGYYAKLKAARAKGRKDPAIPRLTKKQIAEIARRYQTFASAYSPDVYA